MASGMEVGNYKYKYITNIVKLYVMANLIATFRGYRAEECRLGCTGAGTVHGGMLYQAKGIVRIE